MLTFCWPFFVKVLFTNKCSKPQHKRNYNRFIVNINEWDEFWIIKKTWQVVFRSCGDHPSHDTLWVSFSVVMVSECTILLQYQVSWNIHLDQQLASTGSIFFHILDFWFQEFTYFLEVWPILWVLLPAPVETIFWHLVTITVDCTCGLFEWHSDIDTSEWWSGNLILNWDNATGLQQLVYCQWFWEDLLSNLYSGR